jgi:hypothetical protein
MGKNLDTDNIFGSYMNNVLLKEAVKPTESNAPVAPLTTQERAYADSVKAQGKNWTDAQARLMFAKQNQVKQGATNTGPKPASPAPVTPAPVAPIPAAPADAPAPQASNQNQDDDGIDWDSVEPTETTTQVIPNAVKTSTVAAPNTSRIRPAAGGSINNSQDMGEPTETTRQVIPNATQTTSIAAGDDEFEQNDEESVEYTPEKKETQYTSKKDEREYTPEKKETQYTSKKDEREYTPEKDETQYTSKKDEREYTPKKDETVYKSEKIEKKFGNISEKRNISKFLRHLSEKNYSTAHKYLKAVLNSKINNIVAERINKNFN